LYHSPVKAGAFTRKRLLLSAVPQFSVSGPGE
jgi:hypothetical protein